MRLIIFEPSAFDEFGEWGEIDRKTFKRLRALIIETARTPFDGTGKPEPLKGNYRGCWSRRITSEHRLVYRVSDAAIEIVTCRGHYDD
jgi:toxin YoeB